MDNLHLPCGDKPLHLAECEKVLHITEAGEYDVTDYDTVVVEIQEG